MQVARLGVWQDRSFLRQIWKGTTEFTEEKNNGIAQKSSMGAHSPIIVRLQGHIAVVIINRPDKLNSMNQDHYNQLGESHRRLDRTADITITVLTGKGRFFSA